MEDLKISSNRSFGIVFFIVFLIIAIYPLINNGDLRIWSLTISIIFFILGLINSRLLTPLNKLWFRFGILLRIFGKDVLNLKYDNSKSYWIKKNGPNSKMKNQF